MCTKMAHISPKKQSKNEESLLFKLRMFYLLVDVVAGLEEAIDTLSEQQSIMD